jgi:hypothetical protein
MRARSSTAADIKKGKHPLRVAHPGQQQTGPEQEAGNQRRQEYQGSAQARMLNKTSAALIMNVKVASSKCNE